MMYESELIDPVSYDPLWYDPSSPCNCEKGTWPSVTASSCICVSEPPISGPPSLACEPPLEHRWMPDGSQACVDPAAYLGPPIIQTTQTPPITGTPTPTPPLVVNPDGTISHGTVTTTTEPGGILAGVLDDDGNLFGFSPWIVAAVAAGAFFMFSGTGKK